MLLYIFLMEETIYELSQLEEIVKLMENELSLIEIEQLIANGLEAKENSYSPYSKFRVGCSLITHEGKYYKGTNVENLTYGLTVCAERSAICNSVVHGEREFKAALVTTDMEYFVTPCGPCRQTFQEFNVKYCLLLTNKKQLRIHTMDCLLPFAAKIHHLKK